MLAVAKGGLAVLLEDILDRAAGRRLDLLVGVDEGQADARGKAPTDAGLADSHKADKDDRSLEGHWPGGGHGFPLLFGSDGAASEIASVVSHAVQTAANLPIRKPSIVRAVPRKPACIPVGLPGPVGPRYPMGLLVVQDGINVAPDASQANQNFKLVSWQNVLDALNLAVPEGSEGE